jgi:hypothetical protein
MRHTEPLFAFGSRVRWSLTLAGEKYGNYGKGRM